jgi:ABC-2 type transport system permease protein
LAELAFTFASMATYSNARAMRALITASLRSILKSPSAVVFSLAFPLIFILVFGFLGDRGSSFSVTVAPAIGADTNAHLFQVLKHIPVIKWKKAETQKEIDKLLSEGEIVATVAVKEQPKGQKPENLILLHSTSSQVPALQQLKSMITTAVQGADPVIRQRADQLAKIDVSISNVRKYKTIDFILPGQLGFSLLAAGVFGTAFVFFNMRQTLVLKRFFATPVRREIIVISEGLARLLFQMSGAVIIIGLGYYAFDFTLVNGWLTFGEMLLLCALGLMVFMGFGFIVSSVAKSESTIPPFSNLITLPQFLLAGTFFSIDNFPAWLQPFCRILPLTYLNDALRKVAFDGAGLWDVRIDILILLIWGVVVYFAASRLFKWE